MKTLKENYKAFLNRSVETLHKKEDYAIFESISEYYEKIMETAPCFYTRYEMAKKRASFYKYKSFRDLQDHLIEFEDFFTSGGGKVLYAETAQEALKEIEQICLQHKQHKKLISYEKILKEINLYAQLKEKQDPFLMTSLYSISSPIHPASFEETSKKLNQDLGIDKFSDSSLNVWDIYKKNSINKAYEKTISITSADFLISDMGRVVFLDQDGEKTLHHAFCDVQIVVAGIDQLLSSLNELELFNSLKSSHKYGDYFPWSQTIINGPKRENELDGPSEMYVIWLDNGRSKILSHRDQRNILNCIHCGACEALCPVSKLVRNKEEMETFQPYSPIDCITSPIIQGFNKEAYLCYACTLCGKCKEVCPLDIPLPELILHNRRNAVENGIGFSLSRIQMKRLKKMFLKRKAMESSYSRYVLKNSGFKKEFGTQKIFPDFNQKSFHVLWSETSSIYTKK